MAAISADRNLLFGMLALQIGLIDQSKLVAAFQAWTLDKARSLGDHLVTHGDLDPEQCALLETLVAQHLKKHRDAGESLAAVPAGRSTRESLARLGDPDLGALIAQLAPGSTLADAEDPDRTSSYSVGTATSDGQRFRVLRPHARGGLGAVFVAMDTELRREVALKQMLDQHADDPTSRQRFLIEAEITGGLEHPGVVPVYGLGTYADGRPYYAMRFIRGDSLKEAIDRFHGDEALQKDQGRRSLEFRRLLGRFVDVCNAIEYGHSRGVLHRDIKPGNIIVGKHGETLVVDWGLAKATGRSEPGAGERMLMPSSARGSAQTSPGSALGTPAYMSPEQAAGDIELLGPRSDVYGLGATLYYLLTCEPPYDGDDVGTLLRRVQRGDFVRPRQLDPSIDPPLEAVCSKALATNPEDRYGSCRQLAEDLERWMADEPVAARREPWTRTTVRWLTRHRTGVTAAGAAVLVALAGTAAVLAVQTHANAALKTANQEVTRANADLRAANARERERFDLAMEAVKLFHGQVGNDLVLKADRFKPLRDKLLLGAADFYRRLNGLLKDQPDRASREAMGNAYFELGKLTADIGDQEAALADHQEGLAVRREIASEPEATTTDQINLARSLQATGGRLGQTGHPAQAIARLEEARDLLEELPLSVRDSDEPRALLGTVYRGMGWLLAGTGKTDAAMSAYKQSLRILTRLANDYPASTDFRQRLGQTHHNIGFLQSQIGQRYEALESLNRALVFRHKLAEENPGDADLQLDLAANHGQIGRLQRETGKPLEALKSYGEALAAFQKLADDNPADVEFKRDLAICHTDIAIVHSEIGKPGEALASIRRALAIQENLAADNPAVLEFRRFLGDSHYEIGRLHLETGQAVEAAESHRRALAIRQKLADDNPTSPNYRDDLAISYTAVAEVHHALGQAAFAREAYDQALSIQEARVKANPDVSRYRSDLASTVRRLGLARLVAGDKAGAVADARRAAALFEGLPSRSGREWYERACCEAVLANTAVSPAAGTAAGAGEAAADQAMALLRRAAAEGYRNAAAFARELALDSLRGRDDFRLLMMDLAMPIEPFAVAR
jgi:serine/threonine-protein kinase